MNLTGKGSLAGGWLDFLNGLGRTFPWHGRAIARRLYSIFSKSGCVPRRTYYGMCMCLDPRNGYHRELILGFFEEGTTTALCALLPHADTFIDVGANIGFYTLLASTIMGNRGKVLAFEPDPRNLASLATNLALNQASNATVLPVAIGDTRRSATLVAAENSIGSFLEGQRETIPLPGYMHGPRSEIAVQMVTLSEACSGLLGPRRGMRILKMDIEGAEPLAIHGAAQLLEEIDVVIAEMNVSMLRAHGFQPEEIVEPLVRAGFHAMLLRDRPPGVQSLPSALAGSPNLLFYRDTALSTSTDCLKALLMNNASVCISRERHRTAL